MRNQIDYRISRGPVEGLASTLRPPLALLVIFHPDVQHQRPHEEHTLPKDLSPLAASQPSDDLNIRKVRGSGVSTSSLIDPPLVPLSNWGGGGGGGRNFEEYDKILVL